MGGTRIGALATTLLVGSIFVVPALQGDAADPPPLSAGNPVVFEAFYTNDAWGFVLSGFYVDSKGNVVAYDRDGDRWLPTAETDGHITGRDLLSKYQSPRYLGTVAASTLRDMRSRLAAATHGTLEHGVQRFMDGGDTIYVGYDYSRSTATYRQVVLAALNGGGINTSDDARLLAAWLHSLECLYGLELPRFRSTPPEMANAQEANLNSLMWIPSLPAGQDPTYLTGATLLGTGFGPLKGRILVRITAVPVGEQRPITSDPFELDRGSIGEWRNDEVTLRFTQNDLGKIRQAVRQVRGGSPSLQRPPNISFRIHTRQCTSSVWSASVGGVGATPDLTAKALRQEHAS